MFYTFPFVVYTITVLIWTAIFKYEYKNKNYLFCFFVLAFALQYVFPVSIYVITGDYANRYITYGNEGFMQMQLCCILFLISLLIGQRLNHKILLESDVLLKSSFKHDYSINYKKTKSFLLIICIIAIYIQYKDFNFLVLNEEIADRLNYSSGKNYTQLLNVSSYFLVLIGVKQYTEGKITITYLIIHAIPAFVIYSLKLQRGHSLYPMFFILIAWLCVKKQKKDTLRVIMIAFILLYFISPITSYMRTCFVENKDFKFSNIPKDEMVQSSFAHAELLSAIIADNTICEMPNSIYGTIVNIIPRDFFKEKPLTLGPILHNKYSGGRLGSKGLHTSSYTTDLLIEGYYNLNVFGVFLYGLLYACVLQCIWHNVFRKDKNIYFLFPLSLFLFGFLIFFTDLGNWLGYLVIYYSLYVILKVIINETSIRKR